MMRRLATVLAVSLGVCAAAYAQEACDDTVDADRHRLLRQLTLDLLGRVPTVEELDALGDQVTEADVDRLLDSTEFSTFVRRHHKDLLWPSTEALDIVNAAGGLLLPASFYYDGGDPERLFLLFVGIYERGGLVPCRDEPAEWDDAGNLVFEDYGDGTRREGYVMVEPSWAPETEVKVCALEARINEFANNGQPCSNFNGMATGSCGCGPNLQHCASIPVVLDTVQSLQDQLLRMVEQPIDEGKPYTEMLLGTTEPVNGRLVHYYRYLAPMAVDPIVFVPPVAVEDLPDIPYGDLEWHDVQRAHGKHSGLLTSISFLLRFQTSRARANRFHHAFLCDPFVAPADGLPSPNDECSQNPNLKERCGCDFCHTRLEPAASWWGRFAEAGTMYVDPAIYPPYNSRCAACARNGGQGCDFICQRFYVTQIGHPDLEPFAGVLKSYLFRSDEEVEHVETGPRGFVQQSLDSGALPACVAEKLFTRLYHREPSADEKRTELTRFTTAFIDSDYDFKSLVKTLVMDPAYGRMVR